MNDGIPAVAIVPPAAAITARLLRVADSFTYVFLGFAAAWDAAGWFGLLPPWWPPVSYVMIAAGVVAGCCAVLIRTLQRRRLSGGDRGIAYSPARGTLVELVALGVLLGAWILRGDAEIPTDPPLAAAQLAAVGLLAVAALLRSRAVRDGGASAPS